MRNPTNHVIRSVTPAGLALLATLASLSITPSVAVATECPNEAVRKESNVNPATGQPYDLQLPECRAYEMVSPLEKGGSDVVEDVAIPPTQSGPGLPVAADGGAVGFLSQSAFGDAENYQGGAFGAANNPYLARRTASGWLTSSALAPIGVIPLTEAVGLLGDITPAAFSTQSSCGVVNATNFGRGPSVVCAFRKPDGSWVASSEFPNTNGKLAAGIAMQGSSADLSHVIFESTRGSVAGDAFLPTDTSTVGGDGLYEVNGLDSLSPELRLVNIDTNGNQIGPGEGARLGGIESNQGRPGPCVTQGGVQAGSRYQAISEDGATVYFTACPSNVEGGVNTIYARIDGRETIAISSPSPAQCTTCEPTSASAAFQGASADGSKAFFLTTQQLTNTDTDHTLDLYEYDFHNLAGKNIIQASGGGAGDPTPGSGAAVQGVVRTSSDGSHVYFVAQGVLTTIPNALGQLAQEGTDNLYAWESNTAHPDGQTRFVAQLSPADASLWDTDSGRRAQTTPDGRYLVFDTYAHLITTGPEAELAEDEAQQVYRYDSRTGQLVRISIGEPTFPASNNGNLPGMNATVAPPDNEVVGALASINDWGRAVSANGSTIVFSTPEQLQANDTNIGASPGCSTESGATGCNVYEWHECPTGTCEDAMHGEVNMLSPGNDAESGDTVGGAVGMSESGADIFLLTSTSLVGQDTDELMDVYDVRMDGGLAAPAVADAGCNGDACQGKASEPPAGLKPKGSSTQQASGNLTAAPFKEVPDPETRGKPRRTSKSAAKCKRGFVHKRLHAKTVCVKVRPKRKKR
jgi:hypothetical protein